MRRVLVAGGLLAAVVLAGCGSDSGQGEVRIELGRRFQDGAETGEPVDVGLLVAGDWDRMVVLCPGDDEATATDRLGFAWDDYPGPVEETGNALLVFPQDDRVVAWSTVHRADGDPCALPERVIPRDEDVVRVEQTTAGLVLTPA